MGDAPQAATPSSSTPHLPPFAAWRALAPMVATVGLLALDVAHGAVVVDDLHRSRVSYWDIATRLAAQLTTLTALGVVAALMFVAAIAATRRLVAAYVFAFVYAAVALVLNTSVVIQELGKIHGLTHRSWVSIAYFSSTAVFALAIVTAALWMLATPSNEQAV